MIYLDNAATTLQKPPDVARAMHWALKNLGSPGRGGHSAAMRAASEAFACRCLAAKLFGVEDPSSVVFCMNATHALNLAIKSIVRQGDRVVITGFEHNAVLRPLKALGAQIQIARGPLFDPGAALESFRRLLTPGTRAAVVNHVSNVFGFVQPLKEIAALCREREIPLIVDASQSAGILPLDLGKLGAAFIAMPGHKSLYGPQGTGLLLCAHRTSPLLEGGSGSDSKNPAMPDYLPDRLEAGTHNMPGIAGLRQGLAFVAKQGSERILQHERSLAILTVNLLKDHPRLRLYASEIPGRQTGVLSFNVRGMDPEQAADQLSQRGIAVRAGLHCAPLAHETAGSFGTVRMSFSAFTTKWEVLDAVRVLQEIF